MKEVIIMIVRDLDGLAEMMHNHIGYIYSSVVSTLETESSFARRFLNGEQWLKKKRIRTQLVSRKIS